MSLVCVIFVCSVWDHSGVPYNWYGIPTGYDRGFPLGQLQAPAGSLIGGNWYGMSWDVDGNCMIVISLQRIIKIADDKKQFEIAGHLK